MGVFLVTIGLADFIIYLSTSIPDNYIIFTCIYVKKLEVIVIRFLKGHGHDIGQENFSEFHAYSASVSLFNTCRQPKLSVIRLVISELQGLQFFVM